MEDKKCCCHRYHWMMPVILLIIGVLWLLTDLGVFILGISWWPIVLIVFAILKLVKFFQYKKCTCADK